MKHLTQSQKNIIDIQIAGFWCLQIFIVVNFVNVPTIFSTMDKDLQV